MVHPPPLSAQRLRELARKYEALASLRDRRDGAGPAATRDELRALASQFPGCLRELDTLGGAEIARRAAACAAAAAGGPTEPWMAWIAAYHELVAASLAARTGAPRTDATTPTHPTKEDLRGDPGLGEAQLRPRARKPAPERERLNATVLRALGERFGVPGLTIARALFPVRRPSPYDV